MAHIVAVDALEILDSRGNPTVEVRIGLDSGAAGIAMVPSGASTGTYEAVELRDGDVKRYGGKGVKKVVASVIGELGPAVMDMEAAEQRQIDMLLCAVDGTEQKGRLGANAILGMSIAIAKAAAQDAGLPLYAYLGGVGGTTLPVPQMNVINGGVHAQNNLDFQEFMIVPHGFSTFGDALRAGAETFHALKALLYKRGFATGQGDEGGFAPDLKKNEDPLGLLVDAIESAGYVPGTDISIAMDPAISEVYDAKRGVYDLKGEGITLHAEELVERWVSWCDRYPIVSLEDGMAEQDWDGWKLMTDALGSRVQLVGDDNFVTNPTLIQKGIDGGIANAVLIKLNQIGSLTETLEAIRLATHHGYQCVVSHRSGETEDTTIADLAVGMNTGQIKTGAPSRSERVAKYNRLLAIEHDLGTAAQFHGTTTYARTRVHAERGKVHS